MTKGKTNSAEQKGISQEAMEWVSGLDPETTPDPVENTTVQETPASNPVLDAIQLLEAQIADLKASIAHTPSDNTIASLMGELPTAEAEDEPEDFLAGLAGGTDPAPTQAEEVADDWLASLEATEPTAEQAKETAKKSSKVLTQMPKWSESCGAQVERNQATGSYDLTMYVRRPDGKRNRFTRKNQTAAKAKDFITQAVGQFPNKSSKTDARKINGEIVIFDVVNFWPYKG